MAFFENNQNPKESYYYDNFDILKVGMHLFSGEKKYFLSDSSAGYGWIPDTKALINKNRIYSSLKSYSILDNAHSIPFLLLSLKHQLTAFLLLFKKEDYVEFRFILDVGGHYVPLFCDSEGGIQICVSAENYDDILNQIKTTVQNVFNEHKIAYQTLPDIICLQWNNYDCAPYAIEALNLDTSLKESHNFKIKMQRKLKGFATSPTENHFINEHSFNIRTQHQALSKPPLPRAEINQNRRLFSNYLLKKIGGSNIELNSEILDNSPQEFNALFVLIEFILCTRHSYNPPNRPPIWEAILETLNFIDWSRQFDAMNKCEQFLSKSILKEYGLWKNFTFLLKKSTEQYEPSVITPISSYTHNQPSGERTMPQSSISTCTNSQRQNNNNNRSSIHKITQHSIFSNSNSQPKNNNNNQSLENQSNSWTDFSVMTATTSTLDLLDLIEEIKIDLNNQVTLPNKFIKNFQEYLDKNANPNAMIENQPLIHHLLATMIVPEVNQAIHLLIDKPDFDVNAKGIRGNTTLHKLLLRPLDSSIESIVNKLLTRNPDLTLANDHKQTPLDSLIISMYSYVANQTDYNHPHYQKAYSVFINILNKLIARHRNVQEVKSALSNALSMVAPRIKHKNMDDFFNDQFRQILENFHPARELLCENNNNNQIRSSQDQVLQDATLKEVLSSTKQILIDMARTCFEKVYLEDSLQLSPQNSSLLHVLISLGEPKLKALSKYNTQITHLLLSSNFDYSTVNDLVKVIKTNKILSTPFKESLILKLKLAELIHTIIQFRDDRSQINQRTNTFVKNGADPTKALFFLLKNQPIEDQRRKVLAFACEILIKLGANVSKTNSRGENPFHLIAQWKNQNEELIRDFVSELAAANLSAINQKDKEKHTPLDYAKRAADLQQINTWEQLGAITNSPFPKSLYAAGGPTLLSESPHNGDPDSQLCSKKYTTS